MKIFINDVEYKYEVDTFVRQFYNDVEFINIKEEADIEIIIEEDFIGLTYYKENNKCRSYYDVSNSEIKKLSKDRLERRKEIKRVLKRLLYDIMYELTKKTLPYGILTGIRPTKIVIDLINKHKGNRTAIKEQLISKYKISNEKAELLIRIAEAENKILKSNMENDISIYVGIPFCPSKCLYCSFTSYPISKYKKEVKSYLDALEREIQSMDLTSKNIKSLYVGGGTPTSLNEKEFEKFMNILNKYFNLDNSFEVTVEAGRPDTITREKLLIMKATSVNRISINPQTMNQRTLELIGRKHTTDDIIETYYLAREIGFDCINMDLIIGLVQEDINDFQRTLKYIRDLDPDNLTIHTMAIKRASRLKERINEYELTREEEIEKMIGLSQEITNSMELLPYYMYRQKNMVGNFENIGYAKKGKECIYNIQIMEEKQTVIAFGAGASSKIYYKKNDRIERVENVKDVNEYINRVGEMVERKKQVFYK